MTTFKWQLQTPINTVIFDCDGTLSTLEGIDVLADKNNVGSEVKMLTAEAMGQTGINPDLYKVRLKLVKPTREQVFALGSDYFAHAVCDVQSVIQIFQRLQKSIYIISAGLYPAVARLGEFLHIPPENIFAVAVKFDDEGMYEDFDHGSPLINYDGKRVILQAIKQDSPVIYIGDGMNDLAVYDIAERFVGYGGAFYHEKIAAKCEFYIKSKSMAALLPLALTQAETDLLTEAERRLYDAGLAAILS
jgi:phosphoserine phosphatase